MYICLFICIQYYVVRYIYIDLLLKWYHIYNSIIIINQFFRLNLEIDLNNYNRLLIYIACYLIQS